MKHFKIEDALGGPVEARFRISMIVTSNAQRHWAHSTFSRDRYDLIVENDVPSVLRALNQGGRDLIVLHCGENAEHSLMQLNQLRSASSVPVAVIAGSDNEIVGRLALKLGADLLMAAQASETLVKEQICGLMRRIQMVRLEGTQVPQNVIRGSLHLNLDCHTVTWRGRPVCLTVTEFEILRLLADRPMHVKTREQILNSVYDANVFVEERTVDSHVKRIRQKLRAVDPEFNNIDTLYGIGYRFRLDREDTPQNSMQLCRE